MPTCKSCGAEIVWIRSVAGKPIPCDAALIPYWEQLGAPGKIVTPNGEVLSCDFEGAGEPTGMGRISHHATCPHADKYRRR